MTNRTRILLVGFGNMGRALARGWLASDFEPGEIQVVDPAAQAVTAARELVLSATTDWPPDDPIGVPDVVVLAIKPAAVADALQCYRSLVSGGTVLLSIVAGKRLAEMGSALGREAPVVRAMPNTPAAIGRGMTVLCANDAVSADQRRRCGELMSAVGAIEWIEDEALMDAVTAVSGSGPAYVFLLIECLAEAGREMGLAPELAERLAVNTISGAAAYAEHSGQDAQELRRAVTSPHGTTEAALEVLMSEGGMSALLSRAVQAATERSRELSVKV